MEITQAATTARCEAPGVEGDPTHRLLSSASGTLGGEPPVNRYNFKERFPEEACLVCNVTLDIRRPERMKRLAYVNDILGGKMSCGVRLHHILDIWVLGALLCWGGSAYSGFTP